MAHAKMWFGTRGHMRWVRCPRVDMDLSSVGWSTQSQYLNGGAGGRGSTSSHKMYDMSWGAIPRNEVRNITDYADGIYDTNAGTNLIYFTEPTTMDVNVLPQLWASPFQQGVEGLTLFPGQTPQVVSTPFNTNGYPARSIEYVANAESRSLWVPIPPGFTAWVGVHGSATGGAGMSAATTSGLGTGTAVALTTLPVTSTTRFSHSFDASTNVDGVLLTLNNLGPSSTARFVWSGTMVQILKTGVTPSEGGFVSGQGHSGCIFTEKPSLSVQYLGNASRDDGQMSVAANLLEVGSWL